MKIWKNMEDVCFCSVVRSAFTGHQKAVIVTAMKSLTFYNMRKTEKMYLGDETKCERGQINDYSAAYG